MNRLTGQLNEWAFDVTQEIVTPLVSKKLGEELSVIARSAERKVDVYTFRYDSMGEKIAGFLVAPKHVKKKLPVIIYNRGGTADFGLVLKGHLFTRFAQLSQWGYIVVGSQYPGNQLSEGKDERGGVTDVASVLRIRDLIDSLDVADETNIGMYGDSRGGMMTYLCMQKVDWIKAALTVGGLTDLESSLARRPELCAVYEECFGNTMPQKDLRSAVKWADKLHKGTPICLLHGSDDERVSVLDTLNFAMKLKIVGHPFSLHVLMGGDHGLRNLHEERDAIIREWFERHLKESSDV